MTAIDQTWSVREGHIRLTYNAESGRNKKGVKRVFSSCPTQTILRQHLLRAPGCPTFPDFRPPAQPWYILHSTNGPGMHDTPTYLLVIAVLDS